MSAAGKARLTLTDVPEERGMQRKSRKGTRKGEPKEQMAQGKGRGEQAKGRNKERRGCREEKKETEILELLPICTHDGHVPALPALDLPPQLLSTWRSMALWLPSTRIITDLRST